MAGAASGRRAEMDPASYSIPGARRDSPAFTQGFLLLNNSRALHTLQWDGSSSPGRAAEAPRVSDVTGTQPGGDKAGPRGSPGFGIPAQLSYTLLFPTSMEGMADLAEESEQVKDRLLPSARLKHTRAHTHAHTTETHTDTHSHKNRQSQPKCSWAFCKSSHSRRICLVLWSLHHCRSLIHT